MVELYLHSPMCLHGIVHGLTKLNSVALVGKQTIPTERRPHVGEVCVNFCGQTVSRGQRNGSLRP
jgi:hypothetical protein